MEATTKRRPVRGLIWGVILGLGLALIAIGQGMAALGTWPPFLLVVAGIVLGVLWSTLGPAKSAAPAATTPAADQQAVPPPEAEQQAAPAPAADEEAASLPEADEEAASLPEAE